MLKAFEVNAVTDEKFSNSNSLRDSNSRKSNSRSFDSKVLNEKVSLCKISFRSFLVISDMKSSL